MDTNGGKDGLIPRRHWHAGAHAGAHRWRHHEWRGDLPTATMAHDDIFADGYDNAIGPSRTPGAAWGLSA
jgi:hypothetical protein